MRVVAVTLATASRNPGTPPRFVVGRRLLDLPRLLRIFMSGTRAAVPDGLRHLGRGRHGAASSTILLETLVSRIDAGIALLALLIRMARPALATLGAAHIALYVIRPARALVASIGRRDWRHLAHGDLLSLALTFRINASGQVRFTASCNEEG